MTTCHECGTEVHPSDLRDCSACGGYYCDGCLIEDYCSDCAENAWLMGMSSHLREETDLYHKRWRIYRFALSTYSIYELRHEIPFVRIVLEYLDGLSVPENENPMIGKIIWG